MIKTITFQKNNNGKYEGGFDSDRGVLQVSREERKPTSLVKIYANIEGMPPVRLLHSTSTSFLVNIDLPTGLKVVIESETPVTMCKFVSNA